MTYDPTQDEPLTAYALGETEGLDIAALERKLIEHPEARAYVEDIRRTAGVLAAELKREPAPPLSDSQRQAIQSPAPFRVNWQAWAWRGVAACVGLLLIVGMMLPSLGRARHVSGPVAELQLDLQAVSPQGGAAGATKQHESLSRNAESLVVQHELSKAAPQEVAPNVTLLAGAHPALERKQLALVAPGAPLPDPAVGRPASAAAPADKAADAGYNYFFEAQADADGDGIIDESERRLRFPRDKTGANTEAYDAITDNPFMKPLDAPLSTFSIDVDTAAYSNMRRFITSGQLPPPGAVRIEELVNYFPYYYGPHEGPHPFTVNMEVAGCPWNTAHRLVRVGLQAKAIENEERPSSNLVFLIDVSGSMGDENKLPLVRQSLRMLTHELGENDRVAIVVYAGASGLVLDSTPCHNKQDVLAAIERLHAGGSTNGGAGIELAYRIATANFIKGGTNRVILATDGDFNVGVTDRSSLAKLIEEKRKTGVFLSILGYGMGNLKDATMEELSNKGNGNYAYIDSLREARKVLVEQMGGTLVTVAKDVKIQVEFNPAAVAAYRLIGYENRILAKEDFNDDAKDAGEIGAGHTVTALYEIVPTGAEGEDVRPIVDELKYQKPAAKPQAAAPRLSNEMLTLKLRYKQPDGDVSTKVEYPLTDAGRPLEQATSDFKFASAVAAYGMILRNSPHRGTATLDAALELATDGVGQDQGGYRTEFLDLIRKTNQIVPGK